VELIETGLDGCFVIKQKNVVDQRGGFQRKFSAEKFDLYGLNSLWEDHNLSWNREIGTIRGLHFQKEPFDEIKLVSCSFGSVYDVVVDARIDSPSYLKYFGIVLNSEENDSLYVPKGFAHGYQTIKSNSVVSYAVSSAYSEAASRGLRYNDPKIGIKWPLQCNVISEADLTWPLI